MNLPADSSQTSESIGRPSGGVEDSATGSTRPRRIKKVVRRHHEKDTQFIPPDYISISPHSMHAKKKTQKRSRRSSSSSRRRRSLTNDGTSHCSIASQSTASSSARPPLKKDTKNQTSLRSLAGMMSHNLAGSLAKQPPCTTSQWTRDLMADEEELAILARFKACQPTSATTGEASFTVDLVSRATAKEESVSPNQNLQTGPEEASLPPVAQPKSASLSKTTEEGGESIKSLRCLASLLSHDLSVALAKEKAASPDWITRQKEEEEAISSRFKSGQARSKSNNDLGKDNIILRSFSS